MGRREGTLGTRREGIGKKGKEKREGEGKETCCLRPLSEILDPPMSTALDVLLTVPVTVATAKRI